MGDIRVEIETWTDFKKKYDRAPTLGEFRALLNAKKFLYGDITELESQMKVIEEAETLGLLDALLEGENENHQRA